LPRDWEAYYRVLTGPDAPAFVVRAYAGLLPAGPVLDLAGGAGRNAFFLAEGGRRVVLLERSLEALRRVRARAARLGLPVYALYQDLEGEEPLPPGPFAGAVMSYFVHRPLFSRVHGVLQSGGLLLIEGFSRREALRRGREKSPRYWEVGELARPALGFELVAFGEGRIALAERSWAVWRRL